MGVVNEFVINFQQEIIHPAIIRHHQGQHHFIRGN